MCRLPPDFSSVICIPYQYWPGWSRLLGAAKVPIDCVKGPPRVCMLPVNLHSHRKLTCCWYVALSPNLLLNYGTRKLNSLGWDLRQNNNIWGQKEYLSAKGQTTEVSERTRRYSISVCICSFWGSGSLVHMENIAGSFNSNLTTDKVVATHRHVHIRPSNDLSFCVHSFSKCEWSWFTTKLTACTQLCHWVCQWYQIQQRPKPSSAWGTPDDVMTWMELSVHSNTYAWC